MSSPSDRDRVAVVGLGPVGATLAVLLGRAGIPTLAIERDAEVSQLARAVALDDEALRVLQAVGLPEAGEPGLLDDRPVLFSGCAGRRLVELPPRMAAAGHPALAFFHQPDLESALRAQLARERAVSALLGHELERFEQEDDRVTLTVRDLDTGSVRRLEAGWLVACDGGRSGVRRACGIRMRGLTSPRPWLVIDARGGRQGSSAAPFEFRCDPRRPSVRAQLPGGRRRWEFMLLPGEQPLAMARPAQVRALLDGEPAEAVQVVRATPYTHHARVAERWRDGRVLLAGDAAHLSPPFAGQGLSAGLRDAHNLAWKLTAVCRLGAPTGLLDSYERERRPHVTRLIALAVLVGLLVETRRPRLAATRDVLLSALLRIAPARRWAVEGRWKPSPRYRRRSSRRGGLRPIGDRAGRQLPQPAVIDAAGAWRALDDVLGPGFSLLACGVDPVAVLTPAAQSALERLGARIVRVEAAAGGVPPSPPGGTVAVADPEGTLAHWLGRRGPVVALVRPDRHVFAIGDPAEASALVAEMDGLVARRP